MKKIFLLLIYLLTINSNMFSQRTLETKLTRYGFDIKKAKSKIDINLKSRSFNESYYLNYGYVDLSIATDKSTVWGQNIIKLNSNFTKSNNFTLGEVLQMFGRNGEIYDILGFTSAGKPVYKTIDIAKTNLKIDSFILPIQHNRNISTSSDKIIVSIYDMANVTLPTAAAGTSTGNGQPTSIIYGSTFWTDTMVLSTQLAYNDTLGKTSTSPWFFTNLKYSPNLTLPVGKSFGLRVQFIGDTANYITTLFSNHDACSDACVVSPAYVFNLVGRQNYVFSAGTANAYDFSGTLNMEAMFGCPAGSEDCNMWFPQNFMSDVYVTSNTAFNVKIDPVTSVIGCSGSTINLESSYSGMDTLNKVTLKWKALGGGTFGNGFDTFTGGSAVYSFDTLGGYKFIILTGTGSNSEVASDTIVFQNYSMKPTLTVTGKISCLTTDSIKIAIANVTGVGISNNIITIEDPKTSRNLATNLNDLNAWFGIKYSWSSGGITNRSDTTWIYTKTPGTYTLTITNFAGCQKVVNYQVISSINLPTLDFTFNPTTVCPNKPVTMTATPAATRSTWIYTYSEAGTQLGTGSTYAHTFTSSGTKSITLSADSSGCKANDVIKSITVKAAADASCKVAIQDAISENIKVYPNPVRNGEVFIQNDMNQTLTIKITDMLGKVIATDKVSGNKTNPIDLSSAPNGVYFVELESKGDKAVQKIIVDKQ